MQTECLANACLAQVCCMARCWQRTAEAIAGNRVALQRFLPRGRGCIPRRVSFHGVAVSVCLLHAIRQQSGGVVPSLLDERVASYPSLSPFLSLSLSLLASRG